MMDVSAIEESMVQRLRFGEGKSIDEDIEKRLDQVFQHGQLEDSSQHNRCQANSLHSFNSFRSSILPTCSIILLEPKMKREIRVGYDIDARWTDIMKQLLSVQGHKQQKGAREYRLVHQLLEICNSTVQDKKWKIVNPNVLGLKQKKFARNPFNTICQTSWISRDAKKPWEFLLAKSYIGFQRFCTQL